ncbi:MAG: glycine cleavage system protein GcvH [Synergistaceae bacterium]|nr:glycine cleavage system protein GcvH [Synergistaceae bacterium]
MIYFEPNFYYTRTNEWAEKRGDENIRVGIDDYSQAALGDIVYVELPQEAGADIKAGDVFARIEATKSVSEIKAPVSGKIIDINQELEAQPGIINFDPFGAGWLVDIKANDLSELDELLSADAYKNYLKN